MTKAAENLKVAQPALSKTISNLEKELGVKLFDRKGKYIELNNFGKTFLKNVDNALMSLDSGQRQIEELMSSDYGEVKLLISSCSNLLADLLGKFKKIYPNITFKISQYLLPTMTLDDFDICIQSSYNNKNIENQTPLLREEIFLAVPENHKLSNRKSINLSEVVDEDFIALRKGTNLRTITDIFCDSCNFTPNIIFESENPSIIRGLVTNNLGVAFVPSLSWGMIYNKNINLLHIKNPTCQRYIYLTSNKDNFLTKSAILFKEFAIEYFNTLSEMILPSN